MLIGVPKEIKNNEYRVAVTPTGVREFVKHGHEVIIEKNAGIESNIPDSDYEKEGAGIVSREEVFSRAEMLYKVKEILPEEYKYMREGLIVFTYIHSNAHREETDVLLKNKIIGVSYEDIEDKDGKFPLLSPMSKIAGRGGFIAACEYSQKIKGGRGLLLANVPGVRSPKITIIGAGSAGLGAAELASAFENRVSLLDISMKKLEYAKLVLPKNVELLYSNEINIMKCIRDCDVLINCILWPKNRKDHLVSRDMLKLMKKEAMIVDVACDENGAIETCRSTSHDDPVYFDEGIMHYCVDNIPSAFSETATTLLCNATLPYALKIANKGIKKAMLEDEYMRKGLCFYYGTLTLKETGLKQNREFKSPEEVLGM
ncbi:Alanine dehydrogenase [Clostridiaceae bacterium BL-3]|nr:Alanine dehydrogenase [Clostridiaceae bacterium BL-3]